MTRKIELLKCLLIDSGISAYDELFPDAKRVERQATENLANTFSA